MGGVERKERRKSLSNLTKRVNLVIWGTRGWRGITHKLGERTLLGEGKCCGRKGRGYYINVFRAKWEVRKRKERSPREGFLKKS